MIKPDHLRPTFAFGPVSGNQGCRINLEMHCRIGMDVFDGLNVSDHGVITKHNTAAFVWVGLPCLVEKLR